MHSPDSGQKVLFFRQTFGFSFYAHRDNFFEKLFFIWHKLMQRWIDQADDDRVAIHGLKETSKSLR